MRIAAPLSPDLGTLLLSALSASCGFAAVGVAVYGHDERMVSAGLMFGVCGFACGWLSGLMLQRMVDLPPPTLPEYEQRRQIRRAAWDLAVEQQAEARERDPAEPSAAAALVTAALAANSAAAEQTDGAVPAGAVEDARAKVPATTWRRPQGWDTTAPLAFGVGLGGTAASVPARSLPLVDLQACDLPLEAPVAPLPSLNAAAAEAAAAQRDAHAATLDA